MMDGTHFCNNKMSKKGETVSKKLAVLEAISKEKKTLFAPFSSAVTHEMKVMAWEKVLGQAKAIGLVDGNRDWRFVRDKLFSVWKSRTMNKRDNARTTGSEGGTDKILDEVDLKIIQIIDKESPVLDGLGIIESGRNEGEKHEIVGANVNEFQKTRSKIKELGASTASTISLKRKRPRESTKDNSDEKASLTIELLKVEVHLRRLQALKLEQELGLGVSQVTKSLFEKSRRVSASSSQTETNQLIVNVDSHANLSIVDLESSPEDVL